MVDAVAAGAWPEKENSNTARINEIYEHVKQVQWGTSKRTGFKKTVLRIQKFWGR